MADISKLTAAVLAALDARMETPDHDKLIGIVAALARGLSMIQDQAYSSEEISSATREVETIRPTTMSLGSFIVGKDYEPWLKKGRCDGIDFHYWNRYHLLLKERFSPDVVKATDKITSKILDHLEDPEKEGRWARRGLVVGHVQSGKTANYIGLIAKAADAGYRVIVVLGGMLNSLRNQTQARIESDFVGKCSKTRQLIGVARLDSDPAHPRHPLPFTSDDKDFNKAFACQAAVGLDQLKVPVVFVIKKNVSTLKTIREWLFENNRHDLREYPLLLIDDEADNASVNTNDKDKDPTAINCGIRSLLCMFSRSSFIGYTATPFANIFIDPDETEKMLGDDLFPKDFILSLDPPTNYFGAEEVFGSLDENRGDDSRYVYYINDNEDVLPLKHKKDFEPAQMPDSMKRAIDCFLLAKTIRLLRGQIKKHHSMMINASRFTAIQEEIKTLVTAFVEERKDAIRNYSALPKDEALQCCSIADMKAVFDEEYSQLGQSWSAIQKRLNDAVSYVSIISINTRSDDVLDYTTSDWPDGRSLIVVGGMSLSRGLTLEGLSVSYILRNSTAYDTILQMGRWFGYRDGYKDLCRVFITPKAASDYAHISEAVEELRDDFRQMDALGLTPMDFGLRVRRHPTSLEITARNKMRTAEIVTREIALSGRFVETYRLINGRDALEHNFATLTATVERARKFSEPKKIGLGWFWKDIPIEIVEQIVTDFVNAQECFNTDKVPLLNFLRNMYDDDADHKFDMLLRSLKAKGGDDMVDCGGFEVFPLRRTIEEDDLSCEYVTFTKHHITGKGDEQAGIPDDEVKQIADAYLRKNVPDKGKNVPDKEYRKHKANHGMNPLLILVLSSVTGLKDETRRMLVSAYGISFPGDPGNRRFAEKTVFFAVNLTSQRQTADLEDGSEDDYEEVDAK